jgi:hypothetical protein
MKKIFRNSRLIVIAFFTVFTASAAPPSSDSNTKNLPIELKFIGSINNQTIFQLNISGNELQNDYMIIIRDENGINIYRENIKAGNFSKKFLFNKDELGDDTLLFEVFSRNTNKSVVYKINRQYYTTDELVVSELK